MEGARVSFYLLSASLCSKGRGSEPGRSLQNPTHRRILEKRLGEGHLRPISELIRDAAELGGKLYACVSSMALLNIARNELEDEIRESTGMASFIKEANNGHLLFI